jgi:peptidoglycan/xylan/chitin deacetylase (PgdA/CDA1 family)
MSGHASGDRLAVLAFHSISPASGPTSIPPATFRMQLDALAERGFRTMTCSEFSGWCDGRIDGAKRVLITFDDGYADFATTAFPALREHSFSAVVFVPTGKLGGREDWDGAHRPPRPLMDWPTVVDLARAGIEFGGHGVSHTDLTRLPPDRRREEIEGSARELSDRLGHRPRCFAAPYGRMSAATLADIACAYEAAFGTRFARATIEGNRFDVPRIEMHYFRNPRSWRGFLQGHASYFAARRALRAVRNAALTARRVLD